MCLQLKAKDDQIAAIQSQIAESEKVARLDSQKKDRQIQQLTKTQKVKLFNWKLFNVFAVGHEHGIHIKMYGTTS